jgi:hypothetical protein
MVGAVASYWNVSLVATLLMLPATSVQVPVKERPVPSGPVWVCGAVQVSMPETPEGFGAVSCPWW